MSIQEVLYSCHGYYEARTPTVLSETLGEGIIAVWLNAGIFEVRLSTSDFPLEPYAHASHRFEAFQAHDRVQ